MIRLVVTAQAKEDVAGLLTYLEREANPIVADEYAGAIRRTLLRLLQFPGSGAPRPALGTDVRVAVIHPYVLIYQYPPSGRDLILLRVLHGSSRITAEILMR